MDLKEKVKKLPTSPGVYLMKDSLNGIIYVGKAKNLKRRVQSYFQNSKSHPAKTAKLVKHLKDFDFILTDTEFEAFILECKLIKQFKPIYNRKMKSPLSYTYIVIQLNAGYPNIAITDSPINCIHHFGPYPNKSSVERALLGIKECYKIICQKPAIKNRACLNHSLGLCIGMCLGGSAAEQYNTIINKVIALLNGTDLSILAEMKQKMLAASTKIDFETAAKYRDYLDAINSLINKEKVIEFTASNKNIAIIEPLSACTIKLLLIKRNKVIFSEKYLMESTSIEHLNTMIKTNILTYFKTKEPDSAREVNRDEIDEAQIIYSYLKGSTCSYVIIPNEWLDSKDNTYIDEACYKLLCHKSKTQKKEMPSGV